MASELPQSRIRKIIKLDPEYAGVSSSAVHMITRATEIFIQDLTSKASIETRRQQRKKVMYEDFHSVIKNNQSLYFLSDVVPKKYKVRELINNKKIQLREDQQQDGHIEQRDEETATDISKLKRPQGILSFTNNNKSESPIVLTAAAQVVEIEEPVSSVEPVDTKPQEDAMVVDVDDDDDEDEDDVMIDS